MGDWCAIGGAAHFNPDSGTGVVEGSGGGCGEAVADYAVYHGVYDPLLGFQHLLPKSAALDRGCLYGGACCGLLCLSCYALGYEPPCASERCLHAVQRLWWKGEYWAFCQGGYQTPLCCFFGLDAGAHMAEEIEDAGRVLPSAMMWASVCNDSLGFIILVTLCFCLGLDWQQSVLGFTEPTQTGIPVIQVLYNSTGSVAATCVLTTILILLSLVGTITVIASSSRQVWAFARDQGFPFFSFNGHLSTILSAQM